MIISLAQQNGLDCGWDVGIVMQAYVNPAVQAQGLPGGDMAGGSEPGGKDVRPQQAIPHTA